MDTYIETAVNLANIIALRETEWGDQFTLSTGLNINGDNAVIAQQTLTSKSSYEVSLLLLLYLHDLILLIFNLAGSCAGLLMRDPHHHLLGVQLPGCPTKMR